MFKIKIVIDKTIIDPFYGDLYLNYFDAWKFDNDFISSLKTKGVEIGEDIQNPDALFFSTYFVMFDKLQNSKELFSKDFFKKDLPIIVCDAHDEGHISYPRNLISDPRVVAILKGSNYKSHKLHVAPYVVDPLWPSCYHRSIIANWLNPEPTLKFGNIFPNINEKDCEKIKVFCGFARRVYPDQIIHCPDFNVKRNIKVHSVMGLKYSIENKPTFVEKHRLIYKYALDKWLLKNGSSAIVGYDQAFRYDSYVKTMLDCDTVVSPWGWGEYCIRDYEALLAGCVLIKPDTSFSETWPELVPNVHYLPINPDFSDLSERIEESFSSEWRNVKRRQDLRNHVLQAWDADLLSNRFLQILKQVGLISNHSFLKSVLRKNLMI
jgi:hypothetical protein